MVATRRMIATWPGVATVGTLTHWSLTLRKPDVPWAAGHAPNDMAGVKDQSRPTSTKPTRSYERLAAACDGPTIGSRTLHFPKASSDQVRGPDLIDGCPTETGLSPTATTQRQGQ